MKLLSTLAFMAIIAIYVFTNQIGEDLFTWICALWIVAILFGKDPVKYSLKFKRY